ncbi:MAG TPA: hypothetical protein V6C78_26580 [Crinalium sp.]|jgi:hypothetical protein
MYPTLIGINPSCDRPYPILCNEVLTISNKQDIEGDSVFAYMLMSLGMESSRPFDPNLALFLADSADVRERVELLNRKILAVVETIPNSVDVMQMATENRKYLSGEQGLLESSVDTCCYFQKEPNQPQGYSERNLLTEYSLGEDA